MSDISEKLSNTNEILAADDNVSVDMEIHIEVGFHTVGCINLQHYVYYNMLMSLFYYQHNADRLLIYKQELVLLD